MPQKIYTPPIAPSNRLKSMLQGVYVSPREQAYQDFQAQQQLSDQQSSEAFARNYPVVSNILNTVVDNPISNFLKGLGQTVDPETGLPNIDVAGPVMTGITGAKNAKAIMDKIIAISPQNSTEAAIQYLRLKYPKLTQFPSELVAKARPLFDFFGQQLGGMDPKTGIAKVYTHGPNRSMSSYVSTGAHETEHAKQLFKDKRIPEMTMPDEKIPGTNEFGKYYQPQIPDSFPMQNIKDDELKTILKNHAFKMYEEQPVEINANAAGKVAQDTFEKFKSHILPPDNKQFDMSQPLTRETFQDIIQDTVMKEWYNKISKPEAYPKQHEFANDHLKWVLNAASEHFKQLKTRGESFWDLKPKTVTDAFSPELHEILKNQGYTSIKNKFMDQEEQITPLTKSIEEYLNLPRPKNR